MADLVASTHDCVLIKNWKPKPRLARLALGIQHSIQIQAVREGDRRPERDQYEKSVRTFGDVWPVLAKQSRMQQRTDTPVRSSPTKWLC